MTVASPAAIGRHPQLAAPQRPGWVRVDMHTHTMWSGDSTTTLDEFEEALVESGLDVVVVTDHHAIRGATELIGRWGDRGPCRVIVGEEIRTHHGEIIGLFLSERLPFGSPPTATAASIREQGGVVYVPHPFDPMRRNLAEPSLRALASEGLVDAVEVLNAKTSLDSLNRRAAGFAAEFDLAAGAGSDAHVPLAIGAAYVEMPDFDGPADFVAQLRHGVVRGHHWDEPRPWSARIVPSAGSH